MKRAFFRLFLAVLPLAGILVTATSTCQAWDNCNCDGGRGYLCPCDCFVDCYTRYAWYRTWHAVNPLMTPLRGYEIPRPAAGCCSHFPHCHVLSVDELYVMTDRNQCEHCYGAVPVEVSPEAAVGFSPTSMRLGQIRNELDVVGAVAAPSRSPAPTR